MNDTDPDLLTVPEAAAALRKSQRFVLDEIRRKNLRAAKFGRAWHITQADLNKYIEAHMSIAVVSRRSSLPSSQPSLGLRERGAAHP